MTQADIEQGRAIVASGDIEGMWQWLASYRPREITAGGQLADLMRRGKRERAIGLFVFIVGSHPWWDRALLLVALSKRAVAITGAVGGIVYLVGSC